MSTWLPHRIGFFLASGDVNNRPVDETADLLLEADAAWAMGWVQSPDGRHAKLDRLVQLHDACKERGIEWALWLMPKPSGVSEALERLSAACEATKPVHVSLNVERPPVALREAGEPDWTVSTAAALFHGALDALHEPASLSLSSYAVRSRWKGHIPYEALPCSVGMPELYTLADDEDVVHESLTEWGAACPDGVVPIVDSFVGTPDRLDRVLKHFGVVPLVVWDLITTDKAERRVIRAHSALYK